MPCKLTVIRPPDFVEFRREAIQQGIHECFEGQVRLHPVHCVFHTNRSMEVLFKPWGYRCSIYHVEARRWWWFKGNPQEVEAKIREANRRPQGPTYLFKEGFVDYWKCLAVHQEPRDSDPQSRPAGWCWTRGKA